MGRFKHLVLCFYLSRKENGNLWAFAFFNVIAIIALAIVLLVYKTWDFGILTYSSLIYTILASLGVLTVLQAILGREPKAVKVSKSNCSFRNGCFFRISFYFVGKMLR